MATCSTDPTSAPLEGRAREALGWGRSVGASHSGQIKIFRSVHRDDSAGSTLRGSRPGIMAKTHARIDSGCWRLPELELILCVGDVEGVDHDATRPLLDGSCD